MAILRNTAVCDSLYADELHLKNVILHGDATLTLPKSSGTLALEGSLSSYLPLAGGTLAGNLKFATGIITENASPNKVATFSGNNITSGFTYSTIEEIMPARLKPTTAHGVSDPNTITETGFYYIPPGDTSRIPPFKQVDGATAVDYRLISHMGTNSTYQVQIAMDVRSNDLFVRRNQSGTWYDWTPIVKLQQGATGTELCPLTGSIAVFDNSRNATIKSSSINISDAGDLYIPDLQNIKVKAESANKNNSPSWVCTFANNNAQSGLAASTAAQVVSSGMPARLQPYQNSSISNVSDANSAVSTGFYYAITTGAATQNRPPFTQSTNFDYRILTTAYDGSSWCQQIATDFRCNDMFLRRRENGTWKPWTSVVRMKEGVTGAELKPAENIIATFSNGANATIKSSGVNINNIITKDNSLFVYNEVTKAIEVRFQ